MFLLLVILTLSVWDTSQSLEIEQTTPALIEGLLQLDEKALRNKRQPFEDYLHMLIDKQADSADQYLAPVKPQGNFKPYEMVVYPYGLPKADVDYGQNIPRSNIISAFYTPLFPTVYPNARSLGDEAAKWLGFPTSKTGHSGSGYGLDYYPGFKTKSSYKNRKSSRKTKTKTKQSRTSQERQDEIEAQKPKTINFGNLPPQDLVKQNSSQVVTVNVNINSYETSKERKTLDPMPRMENSITSGHSAAGLGSLENIWRDSKASRNRESEPGVEITEESDYKNKGKSAAPFLYSGNPSQQEIQDLEAYNLYHNPDLQQDLKEIATLLEEDFSQASLDSQNFKNPEQCKNAERTWEPNTESSTSIYKGKVPTKHTSKSSQILPHPLPPRVEDYKPNNKSSDKSLGYFPKESPNSTMRGKSEPDNARYQPHGTFRTSQDDTLMISSQRDESSRVSAYNSPSFNPSPHKTLQFPLEKQEENLKQEPQRYMVKSQNQALQTNPPKENNPAKVSTSTESDSSTTLPSDQLVQSDESLLNGNPKAKNPEVSRNVPAEANGRFEIIQIHQDISRTRAGSVRKELDMFLEDYNKFKKDNSNRTSNKATSASANSHSQTIISNKGQVVTVRPQKKLIKSKNSDTGQQQLNNLKSKKFKDSNAGEQKKNLTQKAKKANAGQEEKKLEQMVSLKTQKQSNKAEVYSIGEGKKNLEPKVNKANKFLERGRTKMSSFSRGDQQESLDIFEANEEPQPDVFISQKPPQVSFNTNTQTIFKEQKIVKSSFEANGEKENLEKEQITPKPINQQQGNAHTLSVNKQQTIIPESSKIAQNFSKTESESEKFFTISTNPENKDISHNSQSKAKQMGNFKDGALSPKPIEESLELIPDTLEDKLQSSTISSAENPNPRSAMGGKIKTLKFVTITNRNIPDIKTSPTTTKELEEEVKAAIPSTRNQARSIDEAAFFKQTQQETLRALPETQDPPNIHQEKSIKMATFANENDSNSKQLQIERKLQVSSFSGDIISSNNDRSITNEANVNGTVEFFSFSQNLKPENNESDNKPLTPTIHNTPNPIDDINLPLETPEPTSSERNPNTSIQSEVKIISLTITKPAEESVASNTNMASLNQQKFNSEHHIPVQIVVESPQNPRMVPTSSPESEADEELPWLVKSQRA
uniref:Uncharacterized protein n=1 Tax=Stomoxys calcitrans TaxID=35570 RepID=A0A1I8P4U7_STOCA